MPRIYLYKLTNDDGGAPCVHDGLLTLAICKPMIRTAARIGDLIGATLADSVGKLKWDLGRLQERRYQPVRNAMYGLRVNYDCEDVPVSREPEARVDLSFQGPFAAVDDGGCPCLFTEPIADRNGIYVWTIEVDGAARPWYVGQTRRPFRQRMGEHLTKMLAGEYPPHDPEALRRGDSGRLCKGAGALSWPLTIPVLLRNWEALAPEIMAVIRLLRVERQVIPHPERQTIPHPVSSVSSTLLGLPWQVCRPVPAAAWAGSSCPPCARGKTS